MKRTRVKVLGYEAPNIFARYDQRTRLRLSLIVLIAIALTGIIFTAFGDRLGKRSIRSVSDGRAKAEVYALLGPTFSSVSVERAAVLPPQEWVDGVGRDSDERWWYRFAVSAERAEEFALGLAQSWTARQPKASEGGEMRMGRVPPTYRVIYGAEARAILISDFGDSVQPDWWKPTELPECEVLIFADTDEQYSGLSRHHWFYRFQIAYSRKTGVFYFREFRPFGRYSLVSRP